MVAQLFSLSSLFVMPFWFLMVVLPFWKWTQRIIQSPWIILGPALIYAIVLLPIFTTVWSGVSNPTLPGVIELISNENGATLSWVHFLAFDLFVARWIYLDSRERNIFALIISPILVSVLMVGPVGFLIYMVVRTIHGLVRSPNLTTIAQPVTK